ncbi:MAG: AI-2E family transporter [Ruminococcus sp.]|nr:AI-2E family transporter [Ruminococcus sp.]
MDKKTKQSALLVILGAVVFASLMNISSIINIAKNIINLILPIISGLVIAFVLSVPMKWIEKIVCTVCERLKIKPKTKTLNLVSFIMLMLGVALSILLICTMAVPAIISSIESIYLILEEKIPEWLKILNSYNINTEMISDQLESIDLGKIIETLTGGAGKLLNSVVDFSVSIISGISTFGIAFVIAIYVLLSRHKLLRQTKRVLYAHIKTSVADKICRISKLVNDTFKKFLSGQCVEAIILSLLILIAFRIFGLPYAELIAVLTGFFAFIPYVGAFLACFIGALLTLISFPEKAIVCIVVYIVVQFVENQFIYPHVVGNSVGLSPLWTLIAALIGGNLFGPLGMIFFIPLSSVIYSLIRENTGKNLKKKSITIE